MKFTNARIFVDGNFHNGSFVVSNSRFQDIRFSQPNPGERALLPDIADLLDSTDLNGALVIPGLMDIHGHGNSGYDFSTCSFDGLLTMAEYLGKNGVTSFAPTSMSMPDSVLSEAFSHARRLREMQTESTEGRSRLVGIHMEGPYFSHGKRGAQNTDYLKVPDIDGFRKLYEDCDHLIKLVDVAPELDGAMEFIQEAASLCRVSIAHTEADYNTTLEAFANGATHMTHLFNGMNGIHHRAPGPVVAALETPGVFVELICDGIHIHPSMIRLVFNLFPDRVILISDALGCCGMPDGDYELGEQSFRLEHHRATLPDGTLAGSSSNLFDMLKNVVSFGIPLEKAIPAATINPARQLGLDEELGSIAEGKKADFLVCTESLQLKSVYIDGALV